MDSTSEVNEIIKSWLNKPFLEKVLISSGGGENVKVASYEVAYATAKGDNYLSDMFRVNVNFTVGGLEEKKSIIVKCEPDRDDMLKYLQDGKYFPKENAALSITVPKMQRLIEEASNEEIKPFAAKCLYSHIGPPRSVIVMEDLKVLGFKTADKNKGLDMKHSILTVRALARYHAASAVLLKKEPELFQIFCHSPFSEEMRGHLGNFFIKNTESTAKEVRKWPEFGEKYADKLHRIAEIAYDYLAKYSVVDEKNFNVVTHGDLWITNMMFKYSESTGDVEDIRFVDFQLSTIADAAFELQYFLHTTPSVKLVNEHHILVEEYHKTLGETFDLLGHKQLHPSLEKLKRELDNRGVYAVIVACACLPVAMVDPNSAPDFEVLLNTNEMVPYSSQVKHALKIFLPVFEKKGWLSIDNIKL